MTQSDVTLVEQRYDRVARSYDDYFSRHVAIPQQRLTEAMALERGHHVVDLACGTGLAAVDMAERICPGGTLTAVDCSEQMLNIAQQRAHRQKLDLILRHQTAEQAVAGAADASWDAISVRFALAYLDWKRFFLELPRTLRPGGRVAILTSLGTSLPQARAVVESMARELGVPSVQVNVPANVEELHAALRSAGIEITESFTHGFELLFAKGAEAVTWLIDSGYATHPLLERMNARLKSLLASVISRRFETFRREGGVPLEFELAGVIAQKRSVPGAD